MKIYSHRYIHRKASVIMSFLVQFQASGLTVSQKMDSILDVFCEVCEVLQNLIFTEDSWATASDFQQHFGHITYSISNKSTQSQLTICLGLPQRAVCKHFTANTVNYLRTVFEKYISKMFKITKIEVDVTEKKGYLAEAVLQKKAF